MTYHYFMGIKVHPFPDQFRPNTILFSNEQENFTVSMAQDAMDYILSILSHKDPMINAYMRARTVIRAVRMVLANRRAARPSKEDIKITIDVLKEIMDQKAISEGEKENNAKNAYICKVLIEQIYNAPPSTRC